MNQKKENSFRNKGFLIGGIRHFTPKDSLPILLSGAVLVDLRAEYETGYRTFDVPNVLYLTEEELKKNYHSLPKEKPFIVADNVGLRSKEVVSDLVEKGFTNAANLVGGMVDWLRDGLPVKINRDNEMVGECACKLRPKKLG